MHSMVDPGRRSGVRDEAKPTTGTLSAIVLAGGRSSRMGRPKAWLPLGGVPLLTRVTTRVRPFVDAIVVVAAAGQDLPPVDARIVRDPAPDLGPLPALACGLAEVATPWALALACDGPFLHPALLDALVAAAADGAPEAVVPRFDGRLQPLVALYHRDLVPTLAALVAAGERRLHVLGARPRVRVLDEEAIRRVDPAGASFRPLNTPQEWEAAEAAWHAEHGPTD